MCLVGIAEADVAVVSIAHPPSTAIKMAMSPSQTPTLPCPDVQRPATDSRRDAVGGLTNTTWAARCGRLAVNRRR